MTSHCPFRCGPSNEKGSAMSDSTVLHGRRCNARTFPLRCKYCQAEVFYFTCDCGHQAVFGSLDVPWTRHDCQRRARLIDPRRPSDIVLEPAYVEQVQRTALHQPDGE